MIDDKQADPGRPNFDDLARIISGDRKSCPWLPRFLRTWAGSLILDRHIMPLQPGRAEVKEALSKAISAAQVLEDVLDDDRLREFLEDTPYGPFTRRALFDQDLGDLQDRAKAAINLLSTPDGKTKPGRSRAMPQKAFSSKVFCALIVNEAWKFFHGEYPAPRNRTAAAAAEMLWNSSPSPLMQPPPAKTPGWGADPVDGWRPHLKAARRAELDEMRTELQRQLKEYNRYADISG